MNTRSRFGSIQQLVPVKPVCPKLSAGRSGPELASCDAASFHESERASSNPGDLVLDPFFGTGTTGVVAKRLGRSFIGIERDKRYIEVAEKRLKATPANADEETIATPGRRDEPRIPFGWLVERGFLAPGTLLVSSNRRWSAKVRADGTLIAADCRGSIVRTACPMTAGLSSWCRRCSGSTRCSSSSTRRTRRERWSRRSGPG